MNPAPAAGAYNGSHMVLQNAAKNPYHGSVQGLIPEPDTSGWYQTQYGCLKDDPTRIARFHTFPDAAIPRGVPDDPGAASKICLEYRNAWPVEEVDAAAMVTTEQAHPQFAFRAGGTGTVYQIDVESQLRRLDQPLTNCQAVIAADAPLYRNTVAPPVPVNVPAGPQNAANPISSILQETDDCRHSADAVASSMSGRWVNNPTRQDTMRFVLPFAPPGIGSGAARSSAAPYAGQPYYSNR